MRVLIASLFAAAATAQTGHPLPLCVDFTIGSKPADIVDAIVGDEVTFTKTEGDNILFFKNENDWLKCQKGRPVPDSAGATFFAKLEANAKNEGVTLLLASEAACAQGTKMILASERCGGHSHNPRCAGTDGWHSAASHTGGADDDVLDVYHPAECPDDGVDAEQEVEVAAEAECPVCECDAPEASAAPSKPRAGAAAKRAKNSVTLVWAAPANNFVAGRDSFTLKVQRMGKGAKMPPQEFELEDIYDTTAVVDGLSPKQLYAFHVTAHNEMGTSKSLIIKAQTKGGKGGRKPKGL